MLLRNLALLIVNEGTLFILYYVAQNPENCSRITGLQIIFQNLSDIMSGRNEILSDIYENLSDINSYKNLIKS